MKVDEQGRIWFEKGDRVKPKTVARYDAPTQKTIYEPHPKPIGGIRVEDSEVIERKLEDTISFVDPVSGQFQLSTWLQYQPYRTRWEPSDWYDIVEPKPARRGDKAASTSG